MTSHFIPEATANVWMCVPHPHSKDVLIESNALREPCRGITAWPRPLLNTAQRVRIRISNFIAPLDLDCFVWHNDSTKKSGNKYENRYPYAFHSHRRFICAHWREYTFKGYQCGRSRHNLMEAHHGWKATLLIVLICLIPGTNRLINCFSGQIRANIDLSLLKIALAALVQILQTLVNISPNWPEKQLISGYNIYIPGRFGTISRYLRGAVNKGE